MRHGRVRSGVIHSLSLSEVRVKVSAWEPGLSALSEGPASMAYVPRLLPAWAAADPEPAHRVVDGSLVFFDITGFTPLTERLARKGREGAEELSNLLDTVFGRLLMGAEDDGGDLLKWGGDALASLRRSGSCPPSCSRGARLAARPCPDGTRQDFHRSGRAARFSCCRIWSDRSRPRRQSSRAPRAGRPRANGDASDDA